MGKLPAILLTAIALWVAWNVYREGPRHAFGGWLELIYQPQYGEADAPTVSGNLADEILAEDQAPPADPDDEATE